MEEKYIRFYMSFYKAFQGKKSNSLFKTSQSRWSKFERQLVLTSHSAGVSRITKN